MAGAAPPFLYGSNAANRSPDRGFNPKAVTQASWSPRQARPKPSGPLVNFNRHPDSYQVAAYARPNVKAMSPRTKDKVKYTRIVQLFLRICALLGALGMLFCVICIKDTSIPIAWIIRVAPSVAVLHTIYAIFHLCRSPVGRPPGSTASYMLFASILDSGLIPFFVFSAMVCRTEYTSGAYGWSTLFEDPEITNKIVYTTFLINIANGGLHLISLIISIYLAVIFRQITRLPPDMNPLEDNLTARPHKRNKSEMKEKHLSSSTIDSADNRFSAAEDPLISPPRTIPFMHTRAGSAANVTPPRTSQGPDGKRSSHYSSKSNRFSRSDLPSQQQRIYEQANVSNTSLSRSTAQKNRPSSRPTSAIISTPPPLEPSRARPKSIAYDIRDPSQSSSLMKDNWFTYPSSPSPPPTGRGYPNHNDGSPSPTRPTTADYDAAYADLNNWSAFGKHDDGSPKRPARNRGDYTALDHDHDDHEDDNFHIHEPRNGLYDTERDLGEPDRDFLAPKDDVARQPSPRDPLGMNPPTPQPSEPINTALGNSNGLARPALVDLPNPSGNGDLSLHQDDNVDVEPTPIPSYKSPTSAGKIKSWRRRSGKSSAYESLKADDEDETDPPPISSLSVKRSSKTRDGDRKGRVVSNSGVDLDTGLQLGSGSSTYGNYIAGLGVGRRRDVSGKIAEEGRGGTGLHESDSLTGNNDREEENTPKKNEIRAAGWARWRGL
ncbi:hypothetical protein FQN54_004158 [Arachnomyces sp. PD_36]|nr:hypothetical protein FQN54_004158 [Arachnomyces sp. PD_36]